MDMLPIPSACQDNYLVMLSLCLGIFHLCTIYIYIYIYIYQYISGKFSMNSLYLGLALTPWLVIAGGFNR